ncbi:ABC transporter permease [Nocardioides alcanivorans]|uniref:ABC transporter permease n=1 Tax=Nocardioides alcanivorans TaxID=2897352 RepID=UPI001F2920EC|nr:ABC transporter permease [Nocardioides alcanivorans]
MTDLVDKTTAPEPRTPGRTIRWRPRRIGAWLALAYVVVAVAITVLVPVLPLQDPDVQELGNTLGPLSGGHWLGTDDLGRDLFARLMWAVHTSFLAALTAVAVAVVVGLPLGLLAGYLGGWADTVLSRLADVVLTVPALILLLAAQTALDTGIQGQMVVLGFIFAPRILRVVRAETLVIAATPFVQAGRMSGCSHSRMVWRYLLPGVRAQLAVQASYLLGLALVVEAGISFLGIGVRPPGSSLGTLLIGASSMLSIEPRVVLIPAAVLTLLILSLNVLGDQLTEERKK